MSSLNDHAATGGPHRHIQIRPIFGRRQPSQHPIQRSQIAGVECLLGGPGTEGLQDGTSRFQH